MSRSSRPRFSGTLGLGGSTSDAGPDADREMQGYYHHATHTIWVRPGRVRADMAATLAHELAHAVTHEASAALTREVREVVAESVAYAVCSLFGLDMALHSAGYVASWLDDPVAFKVGMAAIHDGAASLIEAIEAAMVQSDELGIAA